MKTNVEVMTGAIESLEREGMWCQGAYYTYDTADPSAREACPTPVSTPEVIQEVFGSPMLVVLGECSEGAVRRAAGYDWNIPAKGTEAIEIRYQVEYLETLLAEKLKALRPDVHEDLISSYNVSMEAEGIQGFPLDMTRPLHLYNDHEKMTGEDIILAMKHVREEVA